MCLTAKEAESLELQRISESACSVGSGRDFFSQRNQVFRGRPAAAFWRISPGLAPPAGAFLVLLLLPLLLVLVLQPEPPLVGPSVETMADKL